MTKALILIIILFTSPVFPDVKDDLVKIIDECQKKDIFSGTVLAAYDGKVIFERSIGLSDREKNLPNQNDTKYNIASLGKLFTSVMIIQLVQEGKIGLDHKVSKYVKNSSDQASIRQLLKHTSGYGDYLMNPVYFQNASDFKETKDLIDLILKDPLLFEPGERFSYSNSGFVLLGGVIENVTGKTYSENLSSRILDPLGMKDSEYFYAGSGDPKRAIGYIKDLSGKFTDNKQIIAYPSPAGGMYSTAGDLFKFERSLMSDNKLLDDKHKLILFDDFESNSPYTLQELLSDPRSGNVYAGGAPGINTLLMLFPYKKYTVIVLSNYDQAAENIERNISDLILRGELNLPKIPAGEFLYSQIMERGIQYVNDNLEKILEQNGYELRNDMLLNLIGYQFLQKGMTEESIIIFKKNTELFPDIANCYDSLGEAYLTAGDKVNAAANYKKVLEMQPGNENAKRMLEKLN